MSYQGTLTQNEAPVSDGLHQLTVTLYGDPMGNEALWTDTYATEVKNGIFNIHLGSGKSLPDSKTLDRSLWLGASVNGTEELRPLTRLTPALYALNVSDQSITKEKLAPDVMAMMMSDKGSQAPQAVDDWLLVGNAATGTDILGTTNNIPLKIHSQNKLMSLIEGHTSLNNITQGYQNLITSGYANVISGGGGQSNHGTGMTNNRNLIFYAQWATIGGGAMNEIRTAITDTTIDEWGQTIAGGSKNRAYRSYSSVGGGHCNIAYGKYTHIGGGYNNWTGDNARGSAIAGGDTNIITEKKSFIGGGEENTIKGEADVIGGGELNLIDTLASHAFIGGGNENSIKSSYGAIGGGDTNLISTSSDVFLDWRRFNE
jgi:hypothetical protein